MAIKWPKVAGGHSVNIAPSTGHYTVEPNKRTPSAVGVLCAVVVQGADRKARTVMWARPAIWEWNCRGDSSMDRITTAQSIHPGGFSQRRPEQNTTSQQKSMGLLN